MQWSKLRCACLLSSMFNVYLRDSSTSIWLGLQGSSDIFVLRILVNIPAYNCFPISTLGRSHPWTFAMLIWNHFGLASLLFLLVSLLLGPLNGESLNPFVSRLISSRGLDVPLFEFLHRDSSFWLIRSFVRSGRKLAFVRILFVVLAVRRRI